MHARSGVDIAHPEFHDIDAVIFALIAVVIVTQVQGKILVQLVFETRQKLMPAVDERGHDEHRPDERRDIERVRALRDFARQVEALDVSRPRDKTNIERIIKRVAENAPGRGLIVLISDLLVEREPLFRALEMLRHGRHDVLVFHVLDEEELTFPFAGTTRFEGMEELDQVLCDPRSLRDGYLEALQEYLVEVRRGCARKGIEPKEFLRKLETFLGLLPKDFQYAVEVRNPRVLGEAYRAILTAHGVAHVYNHLHGMPPLRLQHEKLGGSFPAPFILMRLLTPPDMPYEHAVKAYRPYSKIVRALPEMRSDTVRIVREALAQRHLAYVLVNNRAEGSAPLTVQALADELREP